MRSKFIAIIGLVIFCVTLEGQRYPKRKITKDLENLQGFSGAFIGFELFDPERQKTLYSQNGGRFMTPASTTKLFTFYSALQYLPDSLPALAYVTQGDSLIFWSTGYPLTLHPDHPDSTVVHFLQKQEKQLYYHSRPIKDDRFGPGWGWDDYGAYYGAEKSVFPIYGNSTSFLLNGATSSYETFPSHPGFQVVIDTLAATKNKVRREEMWNEFRITFNPEKNEIDTLLSPFRYSEALFLDLLQGATDKKIQSITDFHIPNNYQTVRGVKADSLYQWMLQASDNLFAEQMLLQISATQGDTLSSVDAIDQILKDQLFPKTVFDSLVWRDGSGLSRYNMFQPKSITALLTQMRAILGEERLFALLPQGGVNGTLEDRYGGGSSPYVFAKTGTLSNNHALVGYLKTKKGKTLIFTFMVNHHAAQTSTIRKSMGMVLKKVRDSY